MIDIKIFRENPESIRKSHEKRGRSTEEIDEVIRLDEEFRKVQSEVQKLKQKKNEVSEDIPKLKKAGKDVKKEIAAMGKISKQIDEMDLVVAESTKKRDQLRMRIPNILHESVPVGKDDSENVEIKVVGKIPKYDFPLKGHEGLAISLDCLDIETAGKVAGARFFYLKNELVLLDLAIQRFAVDHMLERGFKVMEPPLMMRREPYEGVTDLGDFGDVLYKIEGEDLYLIATSEHPLMAYYMNKVVDLSKGPILNIGISPCFRKEAGAHGKDTKGIFRTHQFNKIEQTVVCRPEDSWGWHEKILKNTADLFQRMGIPYHIVNICTGDIGTVAAKKYDIEAWFPVQGKYREVGSCSNCLDYQANRLNIRYDDKGEKKKVHTLNNTVVATGRAMVAILENFQQKDGSVKIPEVLWPYMSGIKVIKQVEKK
jgi:seryl-tRNA synthetase